MTNQPSMPVHHAGMPRQACVGAPSLAHASSLEQALSRLAGVMGIRERVALSSVPSVLEPNRSAPQEAWRRAHSARESRKPSESQNLSRSYKPLTNHPDFQLGIREKKEQEDAINKVFSRIRQKS